MEQISDTTQTMPSNSSYAGFWLRFAALIIDSIIMYAMIIPLIFIFYGGFSGYIQQMADPANAFSSTYWMFVLTILVINIAYFCGMESSARQGTFGKSAVGIKVSSLTGERISFMNAVGRYFAKIISAIILLIGYIMAAFTPKKQALHDMIASTLVVKK
jgi:uncharacterized RDD family membrane protein YckC